MGVYDSWGRAVMSGRHKNHGKSKITIIEHPSEPMDWKGILYFLAALGIVGYVVFGVYKNNQLKKELSAAIVAEKEPIIIEKPMPIKIKPVEKKYRRRYRRPKPIIKYRTPPAWKAKQDRALKKIEADLERDKYWIDKFYNAPVLKSETQRSLEL